MLKSNRLPVVLLAALFAVPVAQAAETEDPIQVREAIMKTLGKNMKAMGAMAKGEQPFVAAQFATHARDLAGAANKDIVAAFPPGSDIGDTEAKPEIWQNMDDFKARAADLQQKANALLAAADGGNQTAMTAAYGDVGKVCKGCHEKYKMD